MCIRDRSLNVCTVLAVTEQLKQKGFPIEINHIKAGLEKVQFPARWEIVRKHPLIIIDGAHNQDGIEMCIRDSSNSKRLNENNRKF